MKPSGDNVLKIQEFIEEYENKTESENEVRNANGLTTCNRQPGSNIAISPYSNITTLPGFSASLPFAFTWELTKDLT